MPIHWRKIVGPAITLSAAVLILLVDRYLFRVPESGRDLLPYGRLFRLSRRYRLGPRQRRDLIGFAAIQFSVPGELFHYTPFNLQRMLVLIVCTPAFAILIGGLQSARAACA